MVAATAILAATAAHATLYDEASMGDLSNIASSPTAMGLLTPGDNHIIGSTIPSGYVIDPTGALSMQDPDYVTFVVPEGYALAQIVIDSDTVITTGDRMFLGIAQGVGVFLNGPQPASGLLGWTLVDASMAAADHDVLPDLGLSAPDMFPDAMFPGATGFSGLLGAGSYTLWILDGDKPVDPYDLDLVVRVPEPATWMLVVAGLGLIVVMRGRRFVRGGDRPASGPAQLAC